MSKPISSRNKTTDQEYVIKNGKRQPNRVIGYEVAISPDYSKLPIGVLNGFGDTNGTLADALLLWFDGNPDVPFVINKVYANGDRVRMVGPNLQPDVIMTVS